MPAKPIDTSKHTALMRERIIRPAAAELLVSRFTGSGQEQDLTDPPNCDGLGRVRHFYRSTANGWPLNPLPIDPAAKALGRAAGDMVLAQVFQNAACGWRCWYCFVPFDMLNGLEAKGAWVTADRLVSLYLDQSEPPDVIDLSGGSPDLTPEWAIWMMDALEARGVADATYLWSDDNLSTDYFFTELAEDQRARLVSYRNYGRVCCFKGFDHASFAFNTGAEAGDYAAQFDRFARYLEIGLDLYGYVTLTGPDLAAVGAGVPKLIDHLQAIHPNLPLRVVPLCIGNYAPTREREARGTNARFAQADAVQQKAIALWTSELERRFEPALRALAIVDVPMAGRP